MGQRSRCDSRSIAPTSSSRRSAREQIRSPRRALRQWSAARADRARHRSGGRRGLSGHAAPGEARQPRRECFRSQGRGLEDAGLRAGGGHRGGSGDRRCSGAARASPGAARPRPVRRRGRDRARRGDAPAVHAPRARLRGLRARSSGSRWAAAPS
jgi:hypothetical protein